MIAAAKPSPPAVPMRGRLKPSELATACGVSRMTIWRWTCDGTIPEDCVEWAGAAKSVARYRVDRLVAHGFIRFPEPEPEIIPHA